MADQLNPVMSQTQAKPQPSKKKPFKREKPKIAPIVPKPQFLSTKETPLTNDPLWKDSFVIDGESGFVSENAAKEFNADAAGYVNLIDQEYKAISDVDKYYAKSIPSSAHAYYHTVLYWYKIALIAQKRGVASREQDQLVRFVQGYGTARIAAGAGEYLEGLGDYTDATGVKHLLRAEEPGDQGHWGHATAQTHGLYETLPAPAIALERVIADLESQNRGFEADTWVPAGVAPHPPRARPAQVEDAHNAQAEHMRQVLERQRARDVAELGEDADGEGGDAESANLEPEEEGVLPTVNLLGWRPAKQLNASQTMEIRGVIDPEDFRDGLVNQRYCVNRELFELVERRLRECRRYKISPIPNTTGGSQVQQVTWRPESYIRSRFKQYIETEGVACSRTNLPARAAIAAKVMVYRTIRREWDDDEGVVNPWACFHYTRYDQVPATWIANRNTLAQRGNDGLINYAPFKTQVTPRTDTLVEYLTKFKSY